MTEERKWKDPWRTCPPPDEATARRLRHLFPNWGQAMTEHGTGLNPEVCADCGVEVEAKHTTSTGEVMWGHRVPPRPGGMNQTSWDFCCRWEPGEERGTVKSADYHYVQGETQRHFRAP